MSCIKPVSEALELSYLGNDKIASFILETVVLTFVQNNTMPVCREQTSCIASLSLKLLQFPIQRYRIIGGENNIITVKSFAILLSSLSMVDKKFH